MPSQFDVARERRKDAPGVPQAGDEMQMIEDLTLYFKQYARERPQTLALICLGVGFVLGWKLKPW